MENQEKPRVGTGVMIWKDNKILLGLRTSRAGAGTYSFPGGKLEFGESIVGCILREIEEECGLKVKNLKFACVFNSPIYADEHFVTVNFSADWESGEPQTFPDEKIGNWGWYGLDELPNPIFIASIPAIKAHKTGENFFDSDTF